MSEINKITGVVVGQYGNAIVLTIVDSDGVAIDISAYATSKTVTLRDPFTLTAKAHTATFVTDGTNGQIQFTPAAGDLDRPGTWKGQVKLESATAVALSVIFDVEVGARIVPSS